MSTSAQNQSIENVSIPDVLNAGIPAIIQNIRAAQRRVSCDDLTARFFDNAVQSAEMLHAQLIDVYNAEADSHNSLVDAAENMQLDLGLKGKEIEELQLQIEHLKRQQQDAIDDATHDANQRADNAERISIELETKLNEMTAMVELRNSQISTLKSQYKEIMKLDPFNLEKRYNKAKSERQRNCVNRSPTLTNSSKKLLKMQAKRAWHLLIKKQRLPRWLMRMPNLRRSRRKCMALLSAVSLQANFIRR